MEFLTRGLVFSLIFMSVLAASVQAQLPSPTVTFIPNQLSAESSFVMVANPGSVGGSVRVTWVTDEGYGHLPFINDKYVCYFSDTDYGSTCGPSPFRYPTSMGNPYVMDIFTFDSEGNQGNSSIEVNIGGLKVIPDFTIDFDNERINLLVYTTPSLANSISYRIFDSNFNAKTSGYVPLTRITGTPYFNSSVELGEGVYYIAFQASSADDFGGGILKADISGGGAGYSGVLQADPIDIDVLVEAGSEPALPSNKRVINTLNQTFGGVTISLPSAISRYVSITIPNSTIKPYESMFYTIRLNSISSSLDINTVAEILSNGVKRGEIPIKMKISYTSGGISDCSVLSNGADCLGGICCSNTCRKKGECCVDSDCTSGTCSSYRCAASSDVTCTSGTCITGVVSCPTGQEIKGNCMSGGQSGVCCVAAGGCASDSECTGGKCCNGACITGAECCSSIDCPGSEVCRSNVCEASGGGTSPLEDIDPTLIMIVGAVAAAGIGGMVLLKKLKGGESEEESFDDEEFY